MTGTGPFICAHCGRPIDGPGVWLNSMVYHPECTQPPGAPPVFQISREGEIITLLGNILEELRAINRKDHA